MRRFCEGEEEDFEWSCIIDNKEGKLLYKPNPDKKICDLCENYKECYNLVLLWAKEGDETKKINSVN